MTDGTSVVPIEIATKGGVEEDEIAYARKRIERVIHLVDEPVLLVRVRLERAADRARVRPAIALGTIDVNGDQVRAHVAGRLVTEAVDLLEARLRDKLQHRAERRQAEPGLGAAPPAGEWRHVSLPTSRPDYFDRPVEDRQLVRHKTFAVGDMTPEEAAFDMEQMDYDFYLFRDSISGRDALLSRVENGSLTVTLAPVPELAVEDAVERLNAGGEPFVFFTDSSTGGTSVVYRRYDGHYGLISTN